MLNKYENLDGRDKLEIQKPKRKEDIIQKGFRENLKT